jgi:hypothetical protein
MAIVTVIPLDELKRRYEALGEIQGLPGISRVIRIAL